MEKAKTKWILKRINWYEKSNGQKKKNHLLVDKEFSLKLPGY